MYTFAFTLVFAFQASDRTDDGKFTPIRLSPLIKNFVIDDDATAFSIGRHKDADHAVAACDKDGRLNVAFVRDGRGKVFTIDLKLDKTPRILLADIDGDERAEILVCSSDLRIYGITDAGLSLLWSSFESFDHEPAPRLGLGDFDGNGHKDIAVLNYKSKNGGAETQSLYIYLNQTGGRERFQFGGSTTFTDEHGYHSTSGLAIGDFIGDDKPEIVVGNDNGWLWLIRYREGKPKVTAQWKVMSGGAIGPGLAAGDLDGHSKDELLVGTNGGDIFVYRVGELGRPEVVAKAHAGRLSYGVEAADLDGDGRDEFLLARGSLGYARMTEEDVVTEIWKLENDQLRRTWKRLARGFVRPALQVQDFDRDGDLDLIVYTPFGKGKSIEVIKPKFRR